MKLLTFCMFSFLIVETLASASPADIAAVNLACETPQKMDAKLYYCSENTEAVASATRCKAALKSMWDNAPKDVDPAFAGLFKNNDGKQQLNFNDSHTDYQTTMTKLSDLVRVTQDKTAMVAQYPTVMVDYPGAANDPSLSAPCYNDEVDKIQKIVNEMDTMILNGISTHSEAGRLRGIGVARDDHLDSNSSAARVAKFSDVAPARQPKSGVARSSSSDITGTRENAVKEALSSFTLRGQLTGSP